MNIRFGFFFGEAIRSLRTNLATTAAAIVTVLIVMYVFGVGAALGSWIVNYTDNVKNDLTVKVWLDDGATDQEKKRIRTALVSSELAEPASFRFVSREDALKEAKEKFPSKFTEGVGNIFPARFEIKAKDPNRIADLAGVVAGMPGLDPPTAGLPNPQYGEKTADRVLRTVGRIEAVIAAIALILGIASVLLIGNTIRLSIFARRREVEVQKLVGATNWFVRWPFMIEGMLCGLAGAVGAVLALVLSYEVVVRGWLGSATDGADASAMSMPLLALILLVLGLALGAAGAALTMRRFLRV